MLTFLKCEQNVPEQRARRTAGRQDLEGRRVRLACRRAEKQARRQAAQSALLEPSGPGLVGMPVLPATAAHRGGPRP